MKSTKKTAIILNKTCNTYKSCLTFRKITGISDKNILRRNSFFPAGRMQDFYLQERMFVFLIEMSTVYLMCSYAFSYPFYLRMYNLAVSHCMFTIYIFRQSLNKIKG